MFDAEGAGLTIADDIEETEDSIEAIIWRSDLPEIVKTARLNYVATRLIDGDEIARLSGESLNPNNCPALTNRLQLRSTALTRLEGEVVSCAVVKLPGATYTIEINREAGRIEHWEVQRT